MAIEICEELLPHLTDTSLRRQTEKNSWKPYGEQVQALQHWTAFPFDQPAGKALSIEIPPLVVLDLALKKMLLLIQPCKA